MRPPAPLVNRVMSHSLSVVICTHDPRSDALARTLDALRRQTFAADGWELLLVDNRSTAPLSERWDLAWHPQGRHVREATLGLTTARLRGIQEATGEVLVFVDDDNVLRADYLATAARIAEEWPMLGTWGGSIIGEYEIDPPAAVEPYLPLLAIRRVDDVRWSNVRSCVPATPWGAGLCVRRPVAEAYAEYCRANRGALRDRTGTELMSSGDVEISYVGCSRGYGMGVFPQLELTHLIPRGRLAVDYLVRIREGIATSREVLRLRWEHGATHQRATMGTLLRAARHLVTYRSISSRMYFADQRARRRARELVARDVTTP